MDKASNLVSTAMSEIRHQHQENLMPLTKEFDAEIKASMQKNALDRRVRHSALLGGLRALDTFTVERFIINDGNKKAFEAFKSFNPATDNLYLRGPTGSGKSHLAAIAARPYLDKGLYYATQMDISREVRSKETKDEETVIAKYAGADVLYIDDLGVAKDTDFLLSLLYEIIQFRYMNTSGGLVVTSNLSLGELAEKFGSDRISSRLAQMCKIFNLVGQEDRRLQKNG